MTNIRSITLAVALAALAPAITFAATDAKETATAAPMADGEIKKVDKDAAKITIKHGEIKNLEMPPMTMVFQVKDALLMDKVKAGDKVRFSAEKTKSGYAVTAVEAVK